MTEICYYTGEIVSQIREMYRKFKFKLVVSVVWFEYLQALKWAENGSFGLVLSILVEID